MFILCIFEALDQIFSTTKKKKKFLCFGSTEWEVHKHGTGSGKGLPAAS
jgi:hypothetical protein